MAAMVICCMPSISSQISFWWEPVYIYFLGVAGIATFINVAISYIITWFLYSYTCMYSSWQCEIGLSGPELHADVWGGHTPTNNFVQRNKDQWKVSIALTLARRTVSVTVRYSINSLYSYIDQDKHTQWYDYTSEAASFSSPCKIKVKSKSDTASLASLILHAFEVESVYIGF